MAFILDEIWNIRNQVIFFGIPSNPVESIRNINQKLTKFKVLWSPPWPIESPHPTPCWGWQPPFPSWIKLNVDVAINSTSTDLAVVARDDRGEVVKVWAKTHHLCSTLQAKASAIFWAVQLAKAEGWHQIVIEGNSKICLDSLNAPPSTRIGRLVLLLVISFFY